VSRTPRFTAMGRCTASDLLSISIGPILTLPTPIVPLYLINIGLSVTVDKEREPGYDTDIFGRDTTPVSRTGRFALNYHACMVEGSEQ
jgi:hypothetical protein